MELSPLAKFNQQLSELSIETFPNITELRNSYHFPSEAISRTYVARTFQFGV